MLISPRCAASSSSAGVRVNAKDWEIVNYSAILFVAIALVAAVWLAMQRAEPTSKTLNLEAALVPSRSLIEARY